jgi:hypothetical protein
MITASGQIVAVNSTAGTAVGLWGQARITAQQLRIVGGFGGTASQVTGTITTGASPPAANPYSAPAPVGPVVNTSTVNWATYAVANPPTRTDRAYRDVTLGTAGTYTLPPDHAWRKVSIAAGATVQLTPGTYGGLETWGAATITMAPGRYVFTGPVSLNGATTMTGTGVRVQLTCVTACPLAGAAGGRIAHNGNGTVNLTGPAPVMISHPNNTATIDLNGSSQLTVDGVNAPRMRIATSGNGNQIVTRGALVIGSVALNGTSSLTATTS